MSYCSPQNHESCKLWNYHDAPPPPSQLTNPLGLARSECASGIPRSFRLVILIMAQTQLALR